MKKENKISPCFDTVHVPPHGSQCGGDQQGPQNGEIGESQNHEMWIQISQALLAWLILLILSPILLSVFVPLLIWKYGVVWGIVKIFKKKLINGFSSTEAVFAVDRFWENSRSSLGLVVELDGAIDIEDFRDEFRRNILEFSLAPTTTDNEPVSQSKQNDDAEQSSSSPTTTPQENPNKPDAVVSEVVSVETPEPAEISLSSRPFAKLSQIPVTFCGYYFWQKANYFLIHEHIRQINQPTDELGLKKAASTLMTLPFPNRRPLWEILVYPNYLGTTTIGSGTTCGSALFIRFHRSLTDSKGLMNIFERMMTTSSPDTSIKSVREIGQLDEVKVVIDDTGEGPYVSSKTEEQLPSVLQSTAKDKSSTGQSEPEVKISSAVPTRRFIRDKLTSLAFLPLRTIHFTWRLIRSPDGIATQQSTSSGEQLDSTNASWVTLPLPQIKKTCNNQNPPLSQSTVEMSLFLEGVTSRGNHKCLNVPEKKSEAGSAEDSQNQKKCQTCIIVQNQSTENAKKNIQSDGGNKFLSNSGYFVTVKCSCLGSLQTTAEKTAILTSIHNQLQIRNEKLENQRHREVVKIFLAILSLFPRHVLRYLIMTKKWGGESFIYEHFHLAEEEIKKEERDDYQRKLFGKYVISQIVPLVGLQWTYTLASAASLKWKDDTVIMSLIANSGILGSLSQSNPQSTIQDHAERITKCFTEELDRLSDNTEEDQDFVSIPIA